MKKNRQLHGEIFPEIGTKPVRPALNPPNSSKSAKTKLPFGPQFGEIVVKHRSTFETPYNRFDTELEEIFQLAKTSRYKEVDQLLSSRHPDDPLDLNRRMPGRNFQTPLFDAAYNKQLGMVKVLLKYSSDPNAADKLKRTPLHMAAINNSVAVCQALLDAKANPDLKDKYKRTALDVAVGKQSLHVVEFLKNWLTQREKLLAKTAPLKVVDRSLEAKYPALYTFLKSLGHLDLFPTLLVMFKEEEEPPSLGSLYMLEPSAVVKRAGSKVLTRKQAREIWKAIPNDVITQVQRTAAGW